MSNVLLFLVVSAMAVVGYLSRHRIRVFIESHSAQVTARPQHVSSSELVNRAAAQCEGAQLITVDSEPWYPDQLQVAMHPADVARFAGGAPSASRAVLAMLVRKARRGHVQLPEHLVLKVVPDAHATLGRPHFIPDYRPPRTDGGASLSDLAPERVAVHVRTVEKEPSRCANDGGQGHQRTAPLRTVFETSDTSSTTRETDSADDAGHEAHDTGRTEPVVIVELVEVGLGEASYQDPISHDLTARRVPFVAGRERKGSDLWVAWSKASRHHFDIATLGPRRHVLHDLGSLNGTYVNGERVQEAELAHNDEIQMGTSGPRFVFSRLSADLPLRTVKAPRAGHNSAGGYNGTREEA